jgi:hypothetical protein
MMMRIVRSKCSKSDLAVMSELKARLEMILIGIEKGDESVVLDQVRDMDPNNRDGSYTRFNSGWNHDDGAFFSNVLSDLLHNMFDDSQYAEPVDDTPKVPKRQQLIGQLRNALSLAEDPKCDVAEFDLLDTDFCVDFDN